MICTCNRRLSHLFIEKNQVNCRNCGSLVECEAEDCENIATQIYVCYAVCDDHLKDAELNYMKAGKK